METIITAVCRTAPHIERFTWFVFLFLFRLSTFCAQEFPVYDNGFIYSESAMGKLKHIVDSLSIKYKSCDLNRKFYSKKQCLAHIVKLDTGDVSQAARQLEKNPSFEDFVFAHPLAKVTRDALIVKYHYTDYHKREVVEFSEIDFQGYGEEFTRDAKEMPNSRKLKGTWLVELSEKTKYSHASLSAIFFPDEFTLIPLKEEYCRQIGYADCLIDTTTEKFLQNAKEGDAELPANWQKMSDKEKQKLLTKMRSTHVVGYCSMDSRPREHAVNIALLSAETTNWEIFLRSHLDIMNDRFDRRSDGSYAQGRRQTYIRELEELNINLNDLIFGITLRMENPGPHHYYGSINRLGRALAESKERKKFETRILQMIEDPGLDNFNRALAFFLFRNYIYNLQDKSEQEVALQTLKLSVAKMPDYMRNKISFEEE